MSLWQRLLRTLGYKRNTNWLSFELELGLMQSLQDLAEHDRRSQDVIAAELLSFALAQRNAAEFHLERWRSLSPREQQVAALICLGYTNREIADRLVISVETVKSHVRNVLYKFNLHGKVELRQILSDWDFSAWR
jgi:DNA-binding CsgD family transcriptional regulator